MRIHISHEEMRCVTWCGKSIEEINASYRMTHEPEFWINEGQEELFQEELLCTECREAQAALKPHSSE
jgi:hypothetical protein